VTSSTVEHCRTPVHSPRLKFKLLHDMFCLLLEVMPIYKLFIQASKHEKCGQLTEFLDYPRNTRDLLCVCGQKINVEFLKENTGFISKVFRFLPCWHYTTYILQIASAVIITFFHTSSLSKSSLMIHHTHTHTQSPAEGRNRSNNKLLIVALLRSDWCAARSVVPSPASPVLRWHCAR